MIALVIHYFVLIFTLPLIASEYNLSILPLESQLIYRFYTFNTLQGILLPIYGAVTILVILGIAILIGIFNLDLLLLIGATLLFGITLVVLISPIIAIYLIDRILYSIL